MRNGPRNYWETDRLLLLGTQRRGRGRDLQVLILRIRRKEEEEEEEDDNNNNNNNNNANNKEEDDAVDEDDYNENDDDGSSSNTSTGYKDNDDNAQCPSSNKRFQKTKRREMGDLLYLCVPVERSLCT